MEESVSMQILNSISNFRLLSSSNASKTELFQRYYGKISDVLDVMRIVLDETFSQIIPDDKLNKMLEEIDATINEASGLVGGWNQMMSKIYFVTQTESIITKMQTYVLELCQAVNSLMLQSKSSSVSMYLEKLDHTYSEKISVVIREASRDIAGDVMPTPETLAKIQGTLNLFTNQELLMEAVALAKIKTKGNIEVGVQLAGINDIIDLVNCVLDKHVEEKHMHSINGVTIPADFCCPLSLELMSDPVIVASGQTYEHVFIKKWLGMGYNVCPKTRQTLGHAKLIPNYTVKQLIENWCDIHGIVLPDPVKLLSLNIPDSLNLTNENPSDKYPSTNSSLSANKSGSPKHSEPSALDAKAQCLSDGNSDSDDRISSFEDTDDSESDSLRLSASAATRKTLFGEKTGDSEVIVQLSEGGFKFPDAGQHHESNVCCDNIRRIESGEDNVRAEVLSDSSVSNATQDCPVATCSKVELDVLSRYGGVPRNQSIWWRQLDRSDPRIVSTSANSRSDSPGIESKVRKLIEDLKIDSFELQRPATEELRLLSRHNMENRIAIANFGAIPILVSLLYSSDPSTQENAVTILLNLSLNDNNKIAIANAEAVEPLIHVLQVGNPEAKANSAATLFSMSIIGENKTKIGRSGAIQPLVDLLGEGTLQGRRDAATALFNLSMLHENKARIVQAGAVKHLVELMDPAAGMVDKAVAVIANLATVQEGRTGIAQAGGIPILVEVVELGSPRSKENAAAALLQLCTNSNRFCSLVLQECAVPPLVALSQSGTARAREKAQILLSYFRNQRHVRAGRG